MPKKTRRAAIYVRISDDRRGESAGVRRQEADCRGLVAERGWTVAGVYSDNDRSAFSGKARPAFDRMLADVRAGGADVIVVWSTDRLYRRSADLERLVAELSGVDVATVKSGDVDLSTADGRAMARVIGAFAARESEKVSERVARAASDRAARGAPSGGPRPFGYESDGVTIRADEARHVRQAYRDLLAGRSCMEIARRLNAKGSTGTRGAPWIGVTVRDVLLRARYAGLREHNGEIVGEAVWRPLVDRETWERARLILTDPSRRTLRGRPARSLLGGLLRCARCGERMNAKNRRAPGREPVPVYQCRSNNCGISRTRSLMEQYVEAVVLERLERAGLPAVDTASSFDTEALAEADDLRARLAAFAELAATMNPKDYADAVAALRNRLAEAEARIGEAGAPAAVRLGVDPRRGWAKADLDTRRAVLRELLERIEVGPGAPGRHGIPAVAHNVEFIWSQR